MLKELTKREKMNFSTKEIAKITRKKLKEEYPNCKFSVTSEYFSMGSSITISLMKSDRKIKKDFKNISEKAFWDYENRLYDKGRIEQLQKEDYHQLNQYNLREKYNPDTWCNGVFLTEKGHNLLKKVVETVQYYNWDNSDIQTDYFDVHFYLHMQLGKWDKPFIDGNNN